MKTILLSFILAINISAKAQINEPAQKQNQTSIQTKSKKIPPKPIEAPKHEETILEKAVADVKETTAETKNSREQNNFFGYISYSPLDLIIPSKIGATLGYNKNVNTTWELEYLKGSVAIPFLVKDLGKMTDERISIIGRSYMGSNSFNFNYGLSYYDFTVHLGDAILNRMTSGVYPFIDVLEIQSLGFNIGIGNRWTFAKNLSLGVDWISWSQPIYTISRKSDFLKYATNQSDKDDVDKTLRWIAHFPRLTLLKLQLGVTF